LQKVALIREYFPTAGITTDIICGFPGESEQNHAETLAFVREAGFSDIHIFPYSPRPGTEAAKRAQIPVSVRKRRAAELETVRGRLSEDFRKAVLGTTCETLTEQAANGCVTGYSGNYLKVYLSADKKPDMLYNVKIMEIFQEGVKGEVL
jgi:threonylcarbamoyladenosine tRNA methylthiotransferase MtaB